MPKYALAMTVKKDDDHWMAFDLDGLLLDYNLAAGMEFSLAELVPWTCGTLTSVTGVQVLPRHYYEDKDGPVLEAAASALIVVFLADIDARWFDHETKEDLLGSIEALEAYGWTVGEISDPWYEWLNAASGNALPDAEEKEDAPTEPIPST